MPVTELTINIAIFSGMIGAVAGVTAMFVSVRERVKDHEERLRFHSAEITELRKYEAKSATQYALLVQKVDAIMALLESMKEK